MDWLIQQWKVSVVSSMTLFRPVHMVFIKKQNVFKYALALAHFFQQLNHTGHKNKIIFGILL